MANRDSLPTTVIIAENVDGESAEGLGESQDRKKLQLDLPLLRTSEIEANRGQLNSTRNPNGAKLTKQDAEQLEQAIR